MAQNIIDSTHGSGAGSFELGGPFIPTGFDFMRFVTGSTTITGWTVGGASGVDWLRNSGHRAAAGTYSLDLKGTVAGAFGEISTTIPTNPGCVYRLRFKAYGGGISISNSGLVSAANLINAPFQPPGQSPPVAVYQDFQFAFTALATTTTIRFRSDVSSDSFGPIIDDVIVTILGCNPVVVTQPSSGSACPADSAVFTVSMAGSVPFNYQWQWQPAGTGTAWVALANGTNNNNLGTPVLSVSAATTAAVTIRSISGVGGLVGNFRCIVTNPWGNVTSNEATLTIRAGASDIAGAGGVVGPDGELTADDIIRFINAFTVNNMSVADITGPATPGTPDGELTSDDIILFISRFTAGC